MKAFDKTAGAWRLRDRHFLRLIENLKAAGTIESADRQTAAAFNYIWMASQAGENRRVQIWLTELGTAVDRHPVVGGPR